MQPISEVAFFNSRLLLTIYIGFTVALLESGTGYVKLKAAYRWSTQVTPLDHPHNRLETGMHQDQLKSLFDLLVKEFRIWETLLRLTREERQALFAGNMSILATLAIQKERMFGELALFQHSRLEFLKYLLGSQYCRQDYLKSPSMQAMLENFTPQEAACLLHIAEGIEILVIQLEDQARGNYALADCAMKRAWALQTWLQVTSQNSLSSPLTQLIAARSQLKTGNLPLHIPT
jgi:FlgN protein